MEKRHKKQRSYSKIHRNTFLTEVKNHPRASQIKHRNSTQTKFRAQLPSIKNSYVL